MPFTNKLEAGEEIIFGPVVTDLELKSGRQSDLHQITAAPDANRTVAITNQHILVATGSRMITIPNDNVRLIYLGQQKTKSGRSTYTLLRAYRTSNQVAQLDIPGLDESGKARLGEIFPNAEIQVRSGKRLIWVVGAVVLLGVLLTLAILLLR